MTIKLIRTLGDRPAGASTPAERVGRAWRGPTPPLTARGPRGCAVTAEHVPSSPFGKSLGVKQPFLTRCVSVRKGRGLGASSHPSSQSLNRTAQQREGGGGRSPRVPGLAWVGTGPTGTPALRSSQPLRGSEPGTKVAVAMPAVMTGVTDAVWCGGEAGR